MVRTLAFFDLFDHPLTLYELYAWLLRDDSVIPLDQGPGQAIRNPVSWSAFRDMVDTLEHEGHIRVIDGMLMLAGREQLVETRRGRQAGIARNMKRAIRAARLLRWLPFVEMVAVCNRLSVGNPHEESDIDVFIVIRDGRLWFSRLLVTAVLQLAGLRRHGDQIANRVCLSFYLTPRAADLQAIALQGSNDVYLRYWVAHLIPLFARKKVLEDFWHANEWAHHALHQAPQPMPLLRDRASVVVYVAEWLLGGWVGNACERVCRALQLRRMGHGAADRHDTAVVISDTMLKFHENDRREWYATQWRERARALGI